LRLVPSKARNSGGSGRELYDFRPFPFVLSSLLMRSIKRFFTTYHLTILTGFFIGTSFIPFPPWASMFAFVPLWIYLLKQKSAKQVFLGAWISSFVLTFIGFN